MVHAMKFSTAFVDSMNEQLNKDRMWKIIYGSIAAFSVLLIILAAIYAWVRMKRARLAIQEIEAEEQK